MIFDFVQELPPHVQNILLSYLNAKELSIFSLICKQWREISNNDLIWQDICIKHDYCKYEYLYNKQPHMCLTLKSSSSSQSPIFFIQNTETLSKLCKWKDVFIRVKHLLRNWRNGYYTVGPMLKGHKGRVSAFDSDGSIILSASSDENLIKCWSISECDCIYSLKSPIDTINALKIHKDNFLIGGDEGILIVINKKNGDQIKRISMNNTAIVSLIIHKNKILTLLGNKTIKIHSLETYEYLNVLRGHEDEIEAYDCYNNYLATGSWDKKIILWNIQTGVKKATLIDHEEVVNCLKIRDNNKIVSGSSDNTIKIWSMDESGKCNQIQTLKGHESDVKCIDINNDYIISGGSDSLILVWNYEGDLLYTMRGHLGVVRYLFIDENKLVSGGDAKKIMIWNYKKGILLNSLHRNPNKLNLMLLNDTCIITASPENESNLTLILYW